MMAPDWLEKGEILVSQNQDSLISNQTLASCLCFKNAIKKPLRRAAFLLRF
jgi:hypothetical protein